MKRAIGIIRVSQTNGREGDSFISPEDQRARIEATCKQHKFDLLYIAPPELDVSGGKALDERPGLGTAVRAIEAGEADIIVGAYFSRLFRSSQTQHEAISRVEAAGGAVYAGDFGQISNGTAMQRLTANMFGAFAEYERLHAKERGEAALRQAVERGIPPWPNTTPGYVRGEDRRYVRDPDKADAVALAFERRADGATINEVRPVLEEAGITLTYHGVQALLKSRVVLGEINFGKLKNLHAHEPIVSREVWERAQKVRIPRGPRARSDRLLARLGVLRCSSCSGRMVVGTQTHSGKPYPFYRCPNAGTGDCEKRLAIGAALVEGVVADVVREAIAGMQGQASEDPDIRTAESELADAQGLLDALIEVLDPREPKAIERLKEATATRDAAAERVETLRRRRHATVTIDGSADWDDLTLDGRRALIAAVVERVVVHEGRGPGRLSVDLFAQ